MKSFLDFATNINVRMGLTPGPKDHQHQGHFVDHLFRMFLNIRAICYSLGPPPCILKQSHISQSKRTWQQVTTEFLVSECRGLQHSLAGLSWCRNGAELLQQTQVV